MNALPLVARMVRFAAVLALVPVPVLGQELPGEMGQDQAVDYALAHSGLIEAARMGTEALEGKLRQAEWAAWPHSEVKVFAAPMAGQRGTPLKGRTDMGDWGVFAQVEMTAALPLYTFGKLAHLKAAARLGVDVGRAQEAIARAEVAFRVKRGFLALAVAAELKEMLDEGREYLDKARKHLDEQAAADDPSYDPVDRLKLRVYDAQVKGRELEVARTLELASAGLRVALGLAPDAAVGFKAESLATLEFAEEPRLEAVTDRAVRNRPELVAIRRGLAARREEVALRRSAFYPEIFVAGIAKYSYSDVADPQDSPFANDPYNTYTLGGGLGLKWDFEIGKKIGELRESQANLSRLDAEMREAEHAAKLEVGKLFREMVDARTMVKAQKDAMEAARGWVIAKSDLYDNGMCDLSDVLTALVQFFQTRMDHVKAVGDFDSAVLALEKAVGGTLEERSRR